MDVAVMVADLVATEVAVHPVAVARAAAGVWAVVLVMVSAVGIPVMATRGASQEVTGLVAEQGI